MTSPLTFRWLFHAIRGIDRFLFEPRSRTPLRLMRIAFGLFLIAYFVSLYSPAKMLYGTDGLVSRGGAYPLIQIDRPQLFHLLSNQSDRVVWLVICGGSIAGLWLASGFFSRLAPLVAWLFVSSVVTVIPGNSGDLLVMCFASYLAIAGLAGHLTASSKTLPHILSASSTNTLLLRTFPGNGMKFTRLLRWLVPKRPSHSMLGGTLSSSQTIPAWSIRLFQVQLVYVYFFSGYHKLANDTWHHGTALHYIAGQTFWSRVDLSGLCGWPSVTSMMTTAVLLFELLAFPVLVWVKPWRPPILCAGIVFHVTIYATMRVFVFHQVMILYYMAFLLPEDWQAILTLFRPLQKSLSTLRGPAT
jgi:hypothetical protein